MRLRCALSTFCFRPHLPTPRSYTRLYISLQLRHRPQQPRLFMSAAVLPGPETGYKPAGFDPFADAAEGDDSGKDYVHIRVQQRNGKKSLTTIQGLDKSFDYKKILKAFKKEFCCNGNVVEDSELGHVIQLQGDQRKNVSGFLVANKLAKKDVVKIHGF